MQVTYGNNDSNKNAFLEQALQQVPAPQQGGVQASPEDLIKQRIQQALLKQHTAAKPPTLESIGKGFEKNIGEGIAQTANYLMNSPRGQKITGALMASQNPEMGKMMYQSGTALESDYKKQAQATQKRNQELIGLGMQHLRDAEAKREAAEKAAAKAKVDSDKAAREDAELKLKLDEFEFEKGKRKSYTQNQQTAARFAARANAAENVFSDIAKKGEDLGGFGTKLGKSFYTEQGRRLNQATENMISAFLRKESGATISPDEYKSANNNYIPSLNDSPEVLAQKEQARRIQIEGLKQEGGGAYEELSETMETISSEKEKDPVKKVVRRRYNPKTGDFE